MLLAYWQKIPKAHQKGPIPLAVPSADGALASFDALSGSGGCIVEGSGEDQLTIRDLILRFSVNMSKTAICPPWRSKIYGYEFMDIVMDSPQGHLKENRTDKEGLAWISLLRQVNCFFCSGLGDAIAGLKANVRESPCNKLPKGFDWLATTMHSLDALNNRHGSQSTSIERRLADQLSWFMTGSPFQMCQHAIGSQVSCWNTSTFLQEIKDHSQRPQERHGHGQPQEFCDGAVVFGRGRRTVGPITMDSFVGMVVPAQSTQQPTTVLTIRTAQESSMDSFSVEIAPSEHFVQS
ncbi:hypothetical protein N7504_010337 [Penicillium tannophilum]|nr:hypothetical protein N7504_010337 [Penicillium tannophilum]